MDKNNLNDIIGLDNAFNGIDQVYHCAAKVSLANLIKINYLKLILKAQPIL